jgi:transposase
MGRVAFNSVTFQAIYRRSRDTAGAWSVDLTFKDPNTPRVAGYLAFLAAGDARSIGPATEALIIAVMARRPHPEQGFRTCLGILRLFRGLEAARVEATSNRAVEIGALSYASVASILKHRLDRRAPSAETTDDAPLLHANIRGSGYYH